MDINEYIEQHCGEENEILRQIVRSTNLKQVNPHMLSGRVQGRYLSMMSKIVRPRRILELGTFTGYSTLCLAEGLEGEDALLVTIEHNDELEETIEENLSRSPLREKIRVIFGDAIEVLSNSDKDASLFGEPFDLVFVDADKREYERYYELVLGMVREGGVIMVDNTLWDGHITDPAYDRDKQTVALRRFNDMVVADERVESLILPLRDGLTIVRKSEK